METPVAIIHKGSQEYLKWAVTQAATYKNKVVLIGDAMNRQLSSIAKHVNISDLRNNDIKEFAKLYRHMSSNSYNFEFFCFERWFILLSYMKDNEIDLIMHLDSDVMLYHHLDDNDILPNQDLICGFHIPDQSYDDMRWIAYGHCSFWTRKGLADFCAFILNKYKNDLPELTRKWNWHQAQKVTGGICDMTLLYLFYQENRDIIMNNARERDGFCYDANINTGDNFYANEYETKRTWLLNKNKKIILRNGKPFCKHTGTGSKVQFLSLHCQGKAKLFMFGFLQGEKKLPDYIKYYRFLLAFMWKKLFVVAGRMRKRFTGSKTIPFQAL